MRETFSYCRLAVAALTLSSFLSVKLNAQSRAVASATPPSSSSSASSNLTDHLTAKQLKSVANNSAPSSDSAGATHPLALTRITPLHPAIKLKLAPNEARLHQVKFANPELNDEHAPRIFEATAYALRGRTASGVYVRRGIIAADPRLIPLGSVVQVNAGSYSGIYTVHDTGRRIKGRIIDLWMPSRREARKFGRQKIKLQVLRYGPRKESNKK